MANMTPEYPGGAYYGQKMVPIMPAPMAYHPYFNPMAAYHHHMSQQRSAHQQQSAPFPARGFFPPYMTVPPHHHLAQLSQQIHQQQQQQQRQTPQEASASTDQQQQASKATPQQISPVPDAHQPPYLHPHSSRPLLFPESLGRTISTSSQVESEMTMMEDSITSSAAQCLSNMRRTLPPPTKSHLTTLPYVSPALSVLSSPAQSNLKFPSIEESPRQVHLEFKGERLPSLTRLSSDKDEKSTTATTSPVSPEPRTRLPSIHALLTKDMSDDKENPQPTPAKESQQQQHPQVQFMDPLMTLASVSMAALAAN
jgi:hypothetical protein